MNLENNPDKDSGRRILFYGLGVMLVLVGHVIFKGNSHTMPLSFPILVLFALLGLGWLMVDYLRYKPNPLFFIHLGGLGIYFVVYWALVFG